MRLNRLVILMAVLFAVAPRARAADRFVTSYWYGPPPKFTAIEHYRRIKEANFNVVFPPGPPDTSITREQNLKILDFCRELGLKAVLFDPRMPKSLAAADAKANIDAIVADYAHHPALLAYFIVDEPSADAFAGLGDVVKYLKQRDPKHPGYINLFPMHAAPWAQLGTATYDEYVAQFLKRVDPFVLSYDHYPFTKHGDNPHYFTNLAIIRNAAVASDRPFWKIAQLVQHYDYRPLTEPELRFQAMHALAFGARGLLWYTYWYPGEPNETVKHAMIGYDGTPQPEYAWIASINGDARAIGEELYDARSWATFHAGEPAQYSPPPKTPITIEGPGRYTTGVFKGPAGRALALVVNRDYREPTHAQVRTEPLGAAVERFDPASRKWSPAAFPLDLPAGAGVLIRWAGSL
jgi:hypothetical protein